MEKKISAECLRLSREALRRGAFRPGRDVVRLPRSQLLLQGGRPSPTKDRNCSKPKAYNPGVLNNLGGLLRQRRRCGGEGGTSQDSRCTIFDAFHDTD